MLSPLHSRRQILGGIAGAGAALICRRSWGDEKVVPDPNWHCEQVWSCFDRNTGKPVNCPNPSSNSCEQKIYGQGLTKDLAVQDLNNNAANMMGPKCARNGGAIAKASSAMSCTPPNFQGEKLAETRMVCCNGFHAMSSFRISLPNCKIVDIAFDGCGVRRIVALRDARLKAEQFAASICGRICCKLGSVVTPCCERPVVLGCSSCG